MLIDELCEIYYKRFCFAFGFNIDNVLLLKKL